MININDKKRNALNGKVLTAAVACALFMSSGQATQQVFQCRTL